MICLLDCLDLHERILGAQRIWNVPPFLLTNFASFELGDELHNLLWYARCMDLPRGMYLLRGMYILRGMDIDILRGGSLRVGGGLIAIGLLSPTLAPAMHSLLEHFMTGLEAGLDAIEV